MQKQVVNVRQSNMQFEAKCENCAWRYFFRTYSLNCKNRKPKVRIVGRMKNLDKSQDPL